MCHLSLLRLHLCWQLLVVELRLEAMLDPTLPPSDTAAGRYGQLQLLWPCQDPADPRLRLTGGSCKGCLPQGSCSACSRGTLEFLQFPRSDINFLQSCVLWHGSIRRRLVLMSEEKCFKPLWDRNRHAFPVSLSKNCVGILLIGWHREDIE